MKRPLAKLYIIIAAAFALAVILVPSIISKTSTAAVTAVTQADLLVYNANLNEPAASVSGKRAKAVIVMDDGLDSQYDMGYEIMTRYNMKGCISVIPSLAGMQGYMDFPELANVYMDGWDLLNHTYDHMLLNVIDKKEQARQIVSARDWLNEHGFYRGADIVVYPAGEFTDDTKEALQTNGFASGCSLRSVWDAGKGSYREDIEIFCFESDTEFVQAKKAIDKAISAKTTCVLLMHSIGPSDGNTATQTEEEPFEQIVKYLDDNRGKISVVTMTQLFEG